MQLKYICYLTTTYHLPVGVAPIDSKPIAGAYGKAPVVLVEPYMKHFVHIQHNLLATMSSSSLPIATDQCLKKRHTLAADQLLSWFAAYTVYIQRLAS